MKKNAHARTHALRAAALACGLLLVCFAEASAQRSDPGVWNPSAKPKPKPAPRRPAPRPAPRPAAPRARALAVQYRLLKVGGDDAEVEVSPVTVFNVGDRLRFALKADDDVYLYVIQQKGAGEPGRLYFPDTRIGAQGHLAKGEQLVIPSSCPDARAADCSFEIDRAGGQELFTLIFSRSGSVPLVERALEGGGAVSAAALDSYLAGLAQKLDASTRGDTVFARRFSSLRTKSADVVVVRLVLNKRG
jgi:hypothetical protein